MRRRPAVVTLTLALVAAPLLPAASPALAASPTSATTTSSASLRSGDTATVTFTFSEPVRDFDGQDVVVSGGTLSAPAGGGTTYTAVFTPTPGLEGTATVTVGNAGVTDDDGVPGSGTSSATMAVDTEPPTVTSLVVTDTMLTAGETAVLSITFSEAVSGFTTADLSVPNATAGALASSDGGITWTATLTPDAGVSDGTNVVTVDLSGVVDAFGNAGTGTVGSTSYVVDTSRPTGTLVVADTELRAGESTTVTITFSEAVIAFTLADLTVQNGTLGGLASMDGGITWTATLTPAANTTAPSNQVTLNAGSVADLAGNVNVGTALSNAYAVRTGTPTATVDVSEPTLRIGRTAVVTLTFSEPVVGLDLADLRVENGTLGALTGSDSGRTWTAVLTPAADVEDDTNQVTLDASGVRGAVSGLTGAGTTSSDPYAVDTRRPTATVDVARTVLGIGGTAAVTLTFSEPVTGVTPAAVPTTGGTLTGLATADGGVTWTATFVPATGTETTAASVQVDTAAVVDAAGNAGVGVVSSVPLVVDTVAPTAALRLATTRVTGPTTLTVTFSEPVTTLTLAHLVATRGTLSALATADGGRTWTATFTPDAGVRSEALTIRLDLPGVTDLAGNAGAAAALSAAFAVETGPATPGAPVAPVTPVVPVAPVPAAPVPAAPGAAPVVAAAPGAARPALARTGADALALLGTATALLATGLAALRLRTRRRATAG